MFPGEKLKQSTGSLWWWWWGVRWSLGLENGGIRKLDWREEERSNEAIQQAIRLRGINNDCSNLSTHTLFAVHSVYL